MADPVAFLGYEAVFPEAVRSSERFRTAFAQSYRRIAQEGPLAAMDAA
jgi:mannitol-1-phosphate/altronate dehydrogenase